MGTQVRCRLLRQPGLPLHKPLRQVIRCSRGATASMSPNFNAFAAGINLHQR
jgi:hypothetical protein